MVGARGFEPPTPWSRTRCATRLRYAPNVFAKCHEHKLPALQAAANSLSTCGMQSSGHGRRAGSLCRYKQFSRDSLRCVRAVTLSGDELDVAAGFECGYNQVDDESSPNAHELLPDDLGRPLSALAIASLPISPHPGFQSLAIAVCIFMRGAMEILSWRPHWH